MKSPETPAIILPPTDPAVYENVTREYVKNPLGLRAKQHRAARFFDGMALSLAKCLADPDSNVGAASTWSAEAERVALERELHFSMVYDLLNRTAAKHAGGSVDEVLDALAVSEAHAKESSMLFRTNPREWCKAPKLDDATMATLENRRGLPAYQIDATSNAFLESFDVAQWQEAVAAHDPQLYDVMAGRVMPVNAEIASQERECRLRGSVALHGIVNFTVARAQ